MIEWLKSGDGQWTARNNSYTITREADGTYTVRDGHAGYLGSEIALALAKRLAQEHQDGAL